MATPEVLGKSETSWLTGRLITAFVLIALIDVLGYHLLGMTVVVPINRWVDWEQLWSDFKVTSEKISLFWHISAVAALLLTAYFLSKPKWFKATLTVLGFMLFVYAIHINWDEIEKRPVKELKWTLHSTNKSTIMTHRIDENNIYFVASFPRWVVKYYCVNGVGRWQAIGYSNGGDLRCIRKGNSIELESQDSTKPWRWVKSYLVASSR